MSARTPTRTITAYALAVRSPRSGLPAMADGAWWIVSESENADALKEKAVSMTPFLSATAGDAVVLRMEHNPFSLRTKVQPISKYITSGWCGLWQDNLVPTPLNASQQKGFEAAVDAFFDERDAKASAIGAAVRARREALEEERRKRKLLVWWAGLAAIAMAAVAYLAIDASTRGSSAPGATLSEFQRSGGYVLFLAEPDGVTHTKWKVWPDGTRSLLGRGHISVLKDD